MIHAKKTTIAALFAASMALSMGALAQSSSTTESTTTDPATGATTTTKTTTTESRTVILPDAPLTRAEQRAARIQSEADLKARKKIADANLIENKAACRADASGSVEHACKKDAKAQEKLDKADAKMIHESEKADIKADGQ